MRNSPVDQSRETARRLIAEKLKTRSVTYNIDSFLADPVDKAAMAYENTGLDHINDRGFTKKERLYRIDSFNSLVAYQPDNVLTTFDQATQKLASAIGDINMDYFDQENQLIAEQVAAALDTLDIIDILDVGADLL